MIGYTICSTLFIFLLYFIGITCKHTGKETQALEEKVRELVKMSSERAIFRLKGETFHKYIKATPRNYSFIVMLTALSHHRQCSVCDNAYEEFQIVANSWKNDEFNSKKLFFGMVDFDESSDVFISLKQNSVPAFMHFPEKGKPKTDDKMDIQRIGFQAELISKWITERTGIYIRVIRPPSNLSAALFALVMFLVTLIETFLFKWWKYLVFFYNRTAFGLVILSIVIFFASGQMWNHIRGPPFMHFSREGGVSCIYDNNNGQFVLETYIVILLYTAITVGMILMLEARGSSDGSKTHTSLAVVGLVTVVISLYLVLHIFRMKMPSYLYWL